MSVLRSHLQGVAAHTAILVGLFFAAVCWADDPWPDNSGPHTDKKGPCNLGSTYCLQDWCHVKQPGDDPYMWTCTRDNTAYNSWNLIKKRQYGVCYDSSGSCTYYDTFWCVEQAIYSDTGCSASNLKCKAFWQVSGACSGS